MKKYILIADHSKVSRLVLEQYLSEKYNVMVASSIEESKRMLALAIPSMVIVAYELKDGLGYDLCRYINEKLKNIPAVIISSEESQERRIKALESGAIDYIVRKDIDESIVRYIDEVIELLEMSNIRGTKAYLILKDFPTERFVINVLHSLGMQVFTCDNEQNVENEITQCIPDIIIIDLDIGREKGLSIIKSIRKLNTFKNVPIMIFTDSRENAILRSLILFGANDFTLKPLSTESLVLRVTTNIRTKKLYDYLDSMNSELYKLATTDPLTGLFNRRYIIDQLNMWNLNFERYNTRFALMIMDLDYFKAINDRYGHDAGDKVIVDFATTVKNTVRKTDLVGRFGGEELLVMLQNITEDNLVIVTNKILKQIRTSSVTYNNLSINYTASIGVKYCNVFYPNIDMYIKRADDLLYMAKENGKNRAIIETSSSQIEVI